MLRRALLLPCTVALLACKPDPAPVVEPSVVGPTTEQAPAPVDPRGYWIGSLALPNDQSLDWAVAIADPTEAKLWIPAQMLLALPVGAPTLTEAGAIEISLAAVNAKWTITPGDSPSCSFEQQGMKLDCDVEAVEAEEFAELMTPARPQTPKGPFPYAIQEVEIDNPAAAGVRLAGTLTLPAGDGPHPAVVLITGSGLQDRDETIAEHKPFWVIADHLSRNGIAVLRYDDRGFARSTGDASTVTTVDSASDAYAAARWLAAQPGVDAKRIGLIGHSEGGLVAPLVASEHPKDIDFLVLLAGTGVRGSDIIVHQLGLILRASGATDEDAARAQEATRAQHRALLDSKPGDAKAALEQELRSYYASQSEAEREGLGDIDKAVAAQVELMTSPWFRHFLAYDPIPALRQVDVPILILAGDKDLQVDPAQNLPPMQAALKKNRAVEVVRFPGLNHLFQPATSGVPSEYAIIEQTIAPAVLERMTTWLRATADLE